MSWLRVVTYQLPGSDAGEALEAVKAETAAVVAILEEQPGFGGAYFADSPEDNTVSAISHWTSLEAIQSAESALAKVQEMRNTAAGVQVLETHNIGLFAVPAISMWSADEDTDDQARRRLLPSRRFGWRRQH